MAAARASPTTAPRACQSDGRRGEGGSRGTGKPLQHGRPGGVEGPSQRCTNPGRLTLMLAFLLSLLAVPAALEATETTRAPNDVDALVEVRLDCVNVTRPSPTSDFLPASFEGWDRRKRQTRRLASGLETSGSPRGPSTASHSGCISGADQGQRGRCGGRLLSRFAKRNGYETLRAHFSSVEHEGFALCQTQWMATGAPAHGRLPRPSPVVRQLVHSPCEHFQAVSGSQHADS